MPTRLVQRAAKRLPKATIDAWRKVPSAVAADKLNGAAATPMRGSDPSGLLRPVPSWWAAPSPPGASRRITARSIMRSPSRSQVT